MLGCLLPYKYSEKTSLTQETDTVDYPRTKVTGILVDTTSQDRHGGFQGMLSSQGN